jgi:hypothetical protein
MSKISSKINLTQFKHKVMKLQGKSGMIDCIVLPIDANHFYRGEKGIYMDLVGFELKEKRENQTHLIKQSLPKEVYEKMSEQEKNETPIVGGHTVWTFKEPEPVREEIRMPDSFPGELADGLPF